MTLPSLKTVAAELRANKAFGQNFLLDQGLCDDIASALHGTVDTIEIGPGPGGLTRALLSQGRKVSALDIDPRMIEALQPLKQAYPTQLELQETNTLCLDLTQNSAPIVLAGNLPFNIATELLLRWLPQADKISEMLLMFQAEVAERILAAPNTKSYGRLSVLSQYIMDVRLHREIPASAFTPAPNVDGIVLHFIPRPDCAERLKAYKRLDHVLKLAFAARRKTLGRGLKGKIHQHQEVLKAAHIDPSLRAESLDVNDFIRLTQTILEYSD